jgi:uncharacterized protein (DUF433 family)
MMTTWKDRIVLDPDVLAGKPIVRGTRVPVELVLDLLAQGWPYRRVLDNYPQLSREDLLAVLAYARDCLKVEKIYPLGE